MKAAVAGIIVFASLLALGAWWQVYRFHDCRLVGHTMLYCILDR